MDFKSKLATLTRPTPSDASLSKPPGKSETLLELRQKMAEILAASGAPSLSPRMPSEAPDLGALLPFQREERSSGPLFRRHQILPPSHHVGRMPVDAAATTSSTRTSAALVFATVSRNNARIPHARSGPTAEAAMTSGR